MPQDFFWATIKYRAHNAYPNRAGKMQRNIVVTDDHNNEHKIYEDADNEAFRALDKGDRVCVGYSGSKKWIEWEWMNGAQQHPPDEAYNQVEPQGSGPQSPNHYSAPHADPHPVKQRIYAKDIDWDRIDDHMVEVKNRTSIMAAIYSNLHQELSHAFATPEPEEGEEAATQFPPDEAPFTSADVENMAVTVFLSMWRS
jgi:hypothetical protein